MEQRFIRITKTRDRARGLKWYRPVLVDVVEHKEKLSRREFKRCSDAEEYGMKVMLRKFNMDSKRKGLKDVIESVIEASNGTPV